MTTRVAIAPSVLRCAADRSGRDQDELTRKFPKWQDWSDPGRGPTPNQLERFAKYTGIPFGYLLLRQPPALDLPIADFREGHTGGWEKPSTNLLAVVHQSIRRQDWYRAYALENDLPPVDAVGSGAQKTPSAVAADMRTRLQFAVEARTGSWSDTRKHLLRAFEALGGLTVVTSMVENNTHRMLDTDEFRGFSLVDDLAPLVFVNAAQTLNGQIFTLAHEYAHIWRGTGGISAEDLRREPSTEVEALIGDAVEGRTTLAEAMRLMSMKSLSNFDEYARRLGVA